MHKVRIKNLRKTFFSCYRSPSQNRDVFERFIKNLELNFDHMVEKNLSIWGLFLVILRQSRTHGMRTSKHILKVPKLTLLNNSFSRVNLIYIKTESSNRITCSFLCPHKLSLANNICKMLFKCILFTSLLNRGTHLIIFFDWDIEVLFLIQLSAIWKLSSKKIHGGVLFKYACRPSWGFSKTLSTAATL